MLASTLERRWALGHEPIVEVTRPDTDTGLASAGQLPSGLPLASARGLKGMRVVNQRQELLGHVEELMLDVQHGRIAYAVMGAGGFFGLGERYFAIPWAALSMDPEGDCLLIDVARERFERPGPLDEPDALAAWAGGPPSPPAHALPVRPQGVTPS